MTEKSGKIVTWEIFVSGKPGFCSFAAIQRESARIAELTPSVANAFVNKAAAHAPDRFKLSGISSADCGAGWTDRPLNGRWRGGTA